MSVSSSKPKPKVASLKLDMGVKVPRPRVLTTEDFAGWGLVSSIMTRLYGVDGLNAFRYVDARESTKRSTTQA